MHQAQKINSLRETSEERTGPELSSRWYNGLFVKHKHECQHRNSEIASNDWWLELPLTWIRTKKCFQFELILRASWQCKGKKARYSIQIKSSIPQKKSTYHFVKPHGKKLRSSSIWRKAFSSLGSLCWISGYLSYLADNTHLNMCTPTRYSIRTKNVSQRERARRF